MEHWREDAQPDIGHDPNEVTVQLDGLGRELDELTARSTAEPPEGSDTPVFVDESGRRGRHFRVIGAVVGLICAAYAVVIVATLVSGSSSAPWLPSLGPEAGKPAGSVDTSPVPSQTEGPAPSGSGSAAADPSSSTVGSPSATEDSDRATPSRSDSGAPGKPEKPGKPDGGGKSDPADPPSHSGGGDAPGKPDSPGPGETDDGPGDGGTTPVDPPATPPGDGGGEQPAGAPEAPIQ